MPDMLVKLYELPPIEPVLERLKTAGIIIRRPIPAEKHLICEWVRDQFGNGWYSECEVSFSRVPLACFIAQKENQLLGFACYDVVRRGFFGPTGVDETMRGQGAGLALLLACLHDMEAVGYGYGIIGAAGPVDFYKRIGAVEIPDSWPGVYQNMLQETQE